MAFKTAYDTGETFAWIRVQCGDTYENIIKCANEKNPYKSTQKRSEYMDGVFYMLDLRGCKPAEDQARIEAEQAEDEAIEACQENAAACNDPELSTYVIKYWVGDEVYKHPENAYTEEEARRRFRLMHPENTIISVECLLNPQPEEWEVVVKECVCTDSDPEKCMSPEERFTGNSVCLCSCHYVDGPDMPIDDDEEVEVLEIVVSDHIPLTYESDLVTLDFGVNQREVTDNDIV
jgi:hypothetical protein